MSNLISFKTNWKNGVATLSQIKLFVCKSYSKEKCLQYLELLEKFEVAFRLRKDAQVFLMLKFEVGFQLQSDDVVFLIPTLLPEEVPDISTFWEPDPAPNEYEQGTKNKSENKIFFFRVAH